MLLFYRVITRKIDTAPCECYNDRNTLTGVSVFFNGAEMLWLFIACAGTKSETPFPDGLEPLEELMVELPPPSSEDRVAWTSGDEEITLGCIFEAALNRYRWWWSALRQPEVFIDMREIAEYTIEEVEDPVYDYVYNVHNVVHNILTVESDVQWRHGGERSDDQLSLAGVRWQKVAGTDYIAALQGSVQILPVEGSELVEVQVIEHLTATLDQEDNAIQYVTDLYERWNAVVNGDPLPTYE